MTLASPWQLNKEPERYIINVYHQKSIQIAGYLGKDTKLPTLLLEIIKKNTWRRENKNKLKKTYHTKSMIS